MDAAGEAPRWPDAIPGLVGLSRDSRFRGLLERTEAAHRDAATRLRGMGWEDLARRADKFAAWVRFDLDEPRAARRLYAAMGELRGPTRSSLLFGKVLEGALSLGGADRGNIQLVDPATGSLVIVAEHGFGPEFLEYFEVVDDDRSACGRTARRHTQTVIADVTTDPGFAPHRAIAAASGFRAVQSTPLLDREGRLIGVVSTHYGRPHHWLPRERRLMQRYGELAGWVVADRLTVSRAGRADGLPGTAGEAFRRAAGAHDSAAEAHESSIRNGMGNAAEHRRRAELHRAAAEADRRRAERAESPAVDRQPAG